VLGLEDVIFELDRKSVFKLVLSNRFSRAYPVCGKCDYLLHEQLVCPNCGADLSLIDWISNELVEKALFQDAEVYFVDSPSLDEKGGVGAILRYEAARKAV
jgi:peptide subunit release factor 1 (eRF1)